MIVTLASQVPGATGTIIIGKNASRCEQYAAKELQRYMYQLTGCLLDVAVGSPRVASPSFIIGQPGTNPLIRRLVESKTIRLTSRDPGPQGYVLKKLTTGGAPAIVIAANDPAGCLYGTYGLLADHYGVGFFLGGDVLPEGRGPLMWVAVDERKGPSVAVRGILPWTNFPQSATVYSWTDWRFIIDQMAKMRLNFLHIHNYNGELGHNEMYHNFTYGGFTSRVWMPTARTGHRWSCPGWDLKEYLFGASDLFDDYDFGADCALHNETLTNEEVFRKSASLFSRVIAYAHDRGVKVGLGLDINLIPAEYRAEASDPRIISARVRQLAADYPDLDCLLCYQSENTGKNPEFFAAWQKIFQGFYRGVKRTMPRTRIAVSGWGLEPKSVEALPEDVICAPIAFYSDRCESGSVYGSREYWGCPWMERDFNSSEYYYPYNIHLSNTIEAFRDRAPNMKGFTCLTWRLTDAVDPKIYYMSRAPWDARGTYVTARDVYGEYAAMCYGREAASDMTAIINQNEPFASDFGECQATPPFSRYAGNFLLNLGRFQVLASDGSTQVARSAVEYSSQQGIEKAACDEGGECLGYINHGDWACYGGVNFGNGASRLEVRVAAAGEGGQIVVRADSLSGPEVARCMVAGTGGWQNWVTVSCELKPLRGVHDLYFEFQVLKEPVSDMAKAVEQLAVIDHWIARTSSPSARARLKLLRCRVAAERDHIDLNWHFDRLPLNDLTRLTSSWVRNFTHRVTDISSLGNVMSVENRFVQLNYLPGAEELRKKGETLTFPVDSGAEPFLAVISPPASVRPGEHADITVRVLDARPYELTSAFLFYRTPGDSRWKWKSMARRTRAVFAARLTAGEISPLGMEYYVQVTSPIGDAFHPVAGPHRPLSFVVDGGIASGGKQAQPVLGLEGQSLRWKQGNKSAYWYRIYRSQDPQFHVGPENLLTFVDAGTRDFIDNGEDFNGTLLSGVRYYRVTSVSKGGVESPPSNAVGVPYPELNR